MRYLKKKIIILLILLLSTVLASCQDNDSDKKIGTFEQEEAKVNKSKQITNKNMVNKEPKTAIGKEDNSITDGDEKKSCLTIENFEIVKNFVVRLGKKEEEKTNNKKAIDAYRKKDYKKAKEYFLKTLEINPDNEFANYNIACVYSIL